jgi:trigger factor
MEKESSTEKFSCQHLDFSLNRRPNCLVEFDIEAKPELIAEARKQATKLVSREVSIPGFRKGKAPEATIAKHYPKAIDDESKKTLANICFKECQDQVKIPLLNEKTQINFNVTEISSEGAKLKIFFESEPQVPQIQIDGLTLTPAEKQAVTEEHIQKGLRQILQIYANWRKIDDRAAQQGDFILVDLENIEEEPHEKVYSNARFEVNREEMASWMFDLVIGLNPGESRDGISEPDSDATEGEKEAFKPTKVRLTLKSIEMAELPELNEEFAKKVGAPDVEAFRNHVRMVLDRQAEEQVHKKERDQISQQLLDSYDFDLPASLLQKETQFRLRQYLYEPSFLNDWKNMSDEERKKIVESITEDAKRAIRLFYVCRSIIRQNNIPIPKKEVEQEMNNPLDSVTSGSKPESQAELAEQYALALSRVMLSKAQDFILEKVKHNA